MKKQIGWILILVITLTTMLSCATTAETSLVSKTVKEVMESYEFARLSASRPELFHTGVDWYEQSLSLIEEAEDYILISIFLGNLYEVSTDVWDALLAKLETGVRVFCIIDSSSYFQTKPRESIIVPSAFNYLRERGMQVVEYNPFSLNQLAFIPTLLDRDHRKYWIVDGTYLALGGINVNYTSLAYPPGTGNIDTMAQLRSSEAIEMMVHAFVDTWNRYSPETLDVADFAVTPYTEAESSLYLIDHKWPERSQTTILFDAVTAGAKEELWMVQGYAYLTAALKKRIKDATDRGVQVNVIVSENAGKRNYQQAVYHSILGLIEAGAMVYMFEAPNEAFLHLKLIVVDRQYTAYGSPNYNLRSQTFSREIAVLYDDALVAEEALEHIENLLHYCRVIDEKEARELRNFSTLFYHLLMQVYG